MQKVTDWIALWRELVELQMASRKYRQNDHDRWEERADSYDEAVKRRWEKPDSSRDFVYSVVHKEDTFLDIGAGTGAWELLLASHLKAISAIEPSPSMRMYLHQNLSSAGITNVEVIPGSWPEVDVPPHTHTFCAHAMYGCADFERFIQRMTAVTLNTCILILRLPLPGSLMTQAAQKVLGQPHDSPNFVIAYNALLQMGIQANVIMENTGAWVAWRSANLDEAMRTLKDKLGLYNSGQHDDYLLKLLMENLIEEEGSLVWPEGVRSALIHWNP